MKNMKKILPLFLVVLLIFSWYSFLAERVDHSAVKNEWITKAEQSVAVGLYEQAIEYYKESLKYEKNEEVYLLIKQSYEMLYEEEHTAFYRNNYLSDMAIAAAAFPENEVFWLTQVDLHMEVQEVSKAFSVLKKAVNRGVESETIQTMYKDMQYTVKVGYEKYSGFKTALNGYVTLNDDGNWYVANDKGERLTKTYLFAGLINNNGKGVFTNSVDSRILDSDEVARARFTVDVEDAGFYNERVDIVPVKIDGVWKYMKSNGEFLPGDFEIAGTFYGEQAAAKMNTGWVIVDADGNQTALDFEDVKLDLYRSYIQNGIILAKENGKYHLYDMSFAQIGNFEADDMDICIDTAAIAFEKDGKWGFVDAEGNVVVEPQYAKAKSFANGYAAVCNEEGKWGFINSRFALVIDYTYLDAHYFTASETCLVSTEDGYVQFLEFAF